MASTGIGTTIDEPRPERLLLSVAEAAELLGVSRAFAYELVLAGELPSVKLGRLRKVRRGELEAYVAALGGDG
ncbi:MAG: helix-turn-helix domain-containing protein [Actinomycetota bacterium]|nr:helix-turn-helix domain-containing protein [Actinomycetota bacterium]